MGRTATRTALSATYRLQLHKDFPFRSARQILPFRRLLGVSHVDTSPVFSASPGERERLLNVVEAEFDRDPGKRVSSMSDMVKAAGDGRLKLHVTRLTLARRQDPDFWRIAGYEPIRARGARARHIVAFARRLGSRCAVTVAARLIAGLSVDPEANAPVGEACWEDSWIAVPSLSSTKDWTCVLSGGSIRTIKHNGGDVISLAHVFRSAPVAVLLSPGTLDAF